MKSKISRGCVVVGLGLSMLVGSCTSSRPLVFSERQWHVSDSYGQIIDEDTTFRFTFGNVLIPYPLIVVASNDSLKKFPGMDRFVSDILHTARLEEAEILFYAPEMQTMIVKDNVGAAKGMPKSISSPMNDENPYTMWIYEDTEDWVRQPTEMYTYTYYDKSKKRLIIVDCYDYADIPVAQITIFQSNNKLTRKMNVPDMPMTIRRSFYLFHDLGNPMEDVEFWSGNVAERRRRALANYAIGQEQLIKRNKQTIEK